MSGKAARRLRRRLTSRSEVKARSAGPQPQYSRMNDEVVHRLRRRLTSRSEVKARSAGPWPF
jgi:hypothetical protein